MTIYTIMGTADRIEWIAKSFTCERTANNFLHFCRSCVNGASSYRELLDTSPDPTIQTESVKRSLTSMHINYTLHINELVTDAFMELTLQQSKPKHQFKDFL